MGGSAPQAWPYMNKDQAKNLNQGNTDVYKGYMGQDSLNRENSSWYNALPTKTPTDDEWHYLTEDAKRGWNGLFNTNYTSVGSNFPGMKRVQIDNPDLARTREYLNYAPPGQAGDWAQTYSPDAGASFTGWADYSKLPQVNESNIGDYYRAKAFAQGYNPFEYTWQFDESNPLYQALWQKNKYRDDYFDTQAMDQYSNSLNQSDYTLPVYANNINTAKVASAGGK